MKPIPFSFPIPSGSVYPRYLSQEREDSDDGPGGAISAGIRIRVRVSVLSFGVLLLRLLLPIPIGAMEVENHSTPLDGASTADAVFARRCCCFWIPWSGGRSSSAPSSVEWWQQMGVSERGDEREGWWSRGRRAVMKVREWSELVAGPRWKTFIRRFNRNPRHGGGVVRMGSSRFQYDPLSYTLNFDEGHGGSPEGDYTGYRDFSARFVAPPAPVDLAGRDAPPVFSAAGGGR